VHRARGAAGLPGLYSIDPLTGLATFVGQLVDAMGFPASGGFVSLQFGCDGTTYLGSARAILASDGGTLATIGPGDLTSLIFTFAGTPSTAGASLSALAFEGDCSPVVIGDDVVVLPPDDPDVPVTAVVQEVIKPGTIEVTSGCVLLRGLPNTELDLVQAIKNTETPGCNEVEAELAKLGPPEPAARLRKGQRGFTEQDGDGLERFEVAVVISRNTDGDTDQLTKGVFVAEAEPKEAGVPDRSCDTSATDVSQSPFTAGINLSGKESSEDKGRNLTGACNRARDFGHFSNHLLAYPLRNDPSELPLMAQVLQEAGDLRLALRNELSFGCVDNRFLRNLTGQLNRAMRDVHKGNVLEGMCAVQEATLFALDPDGDNPYGDCPDVPAAPEDPAGQIPSRFLTLAYQIHRLLLHPVSFTAYVNDPRVLCQLSTFPGETAPTCPPPDPGLSPACEGLLAPP